MTQQPTENPNGVPIPPKGSGGGSNKVLFIVLGVILFCFIAFGVVVTAGVYYVKNRGANIVKDIAKTQGVDIESYDADSGSGKITIKTKDGEVSNEIGKELPDDFPITDLPVYSGAISSTNRMNMSGTKTWTVIIGSDDDEKTINNTLKENFLNNGWEIVMEQDSDQHSMKSAKKGDYTAIVSHRANRDKDDHASQISYHVTQKKAEE